MAGRRAGVFMKRGEINRKRFSEFSGCKKEMGERGLFGVKCSGHWCPPCAQHPSAAQGAKGPQNYS